MPAGLATRARFRPKWQSFEAWVGTRSSAVALFVLALAVFGLQSVVLPVYPGRDMATYVATFLQLGYRTPVLPSDLTARGPLAAVGVGAPLELGGLAAGIWLALLYASSVVAWGAVAVRFGARAALLTVLLLFCYPGYGILFHELASDSLFAAAFSWWVVLVSRSLFRPSVPAFLASGIGMGSLVLVRPGNQVLLLVALLPLLGRGGWVDRLSWVAAFYVGSVVLTQGWPAVQYLRYGAGVVPRPSSAVLATAVVLLPLLLPSPWRRRLVLVGAAAAAGLVALVGVTVHSPTQYARSVVQSPGSQVFLFRAFELDHIVSPDNGPASRKLAGVVQTELLAKEPYKSYGVDLHEFFSTSSDRVFQDLQALGGEADLQAVTQEAIRRHWQRFTASIGWAIWDELWTRRVYTLASAESPSQASQGNGSGHPDFVVVAGRRLPRPSEGQPIPASRFGVPILTLHGQAREEWRSATDHPLVFDDPQDQRRYDKLGRDTIRLRERIPTRDGSPGLLHRLNQLSHAFPPSLCWLAVGLVGLAVRRPSHLLEALAPSLAGGALIVGTAMVATAVAEYAAPVSPAFILLAAVGLVGSADSRSGRQSSRRRAGP